MTDIERISGLLERLRAAKFAGTLEGRIYDGVIYQVQLTHSLGVEQIERPIVAVEKERSSA